MCVSKPDADHKANLLFIARKECEELKEEILRLRSDRPNVCYEEVALGTAAGEPEHSTTSMDNVRCSSGWGDRHLLLHQVVWYLVCFLCWLVLRYNRTSVCSPIQT